MLACLPRLLAWKNLNNYEYSSQLDSNGLRDLVFVATGGDEEAASEASGQRAMARMRAGLPA